MFDYLLSDKQKQPRDETRNCHCPWNCHDENVLAC